MKLTQNFTLEELIKSDTGSRLHIDNTPNSDIIKNLKSLSETILQPIRDSYGKPIIVTSGYRCPKLNKAVGGSSTSQHLKGEAADLISDDNKALFLIIKTMIGKGQIKVGQLIDEKNLSWIHVSLPTLNKNNQILKL